jgi:hypothetical protein
VLNSVACETADACVAVGEFTGTPVGEPTGQDLGALIESDSNGRWKLLSTPKSSGGGDATLTSVSCPSLHECIAVGQSTTNALHVPSGPVRSFSVLIRD